MLNKKRKVFEKRVSFFKKDLDKFKQFVDEETLDEPVFHQIPRIVKTRRNYKLIEDPIDIKKNYRRIQSNLIENVEYLKVNHPNLFVNGTVISFRKYEFIDCYQTKNNDYINGKVEFYNENTKSFLIKLITKCDDMEIINIPLKDFIDLFVANESVQDEIIEKDTNSLFNSKYGCLRRQVEYYFSDENYYNDSFLLENLDENNYINLNLLLKFNRIKTLTNKISDLIKALKDSEVVSVDTITEKIKKL